MALVEATVVGPFPIADARPGEPDKVKGQTVVLDDERTNVDLLVGFHIKDAHPYVDKKPGKPGGDR